MSSNKNQIQHRHLSHKVPQVPQQQQYHHQYRHLCQKQVPSYSNGNLSTVYESEGSEEYDKDDLINSKLFHEYIKKYNPALKKRLMQQNRVTTPMQSPIRDHGVQYKVPYKQDQNINRIRQKYIQPSLYNESNYNNNILRRRRISSLHDNYEDCDRLQQEIYVKKSRDIKKKLQQHNYITSILQEEDEQLKRQKYQQQMYSSTKKNVPLTTINPMTKLSSSISKSPYVSSIGIEESPRSQRSINLIKNSLSTSINNKHNTEDDVNVYDYNENEEGDDDNDRRDDEEVDYDGDFENDNNENSINNVLNTLQNSLDIPSSPHPRKSEEGRNHCVNYAIDLTNELKSKSYENTDVKSYYKNHNFNNATDGVMTNSNTIIPKTKSTNQQMKCDHQDHIASGLGHIRKISEQTINSIRSNNLNNNADNNTVNNNDNNNRIIHGIGEPNLHKPSTTQSHRSPLIKDNLEFVMTLEKSKSIVIDLIDKQVKKIQNFNVCKTGNDNDNDDNDCRGITEDLKSVYALDGNDNDELNDVDNEIISNLDFNLMESFKSEQQQSNQKQQQQQRTVINPMSKQFRCLKSNCLRKIDLEVKQLRTLETMENGIITKTAASKRKN